MASLTGSFRLAEIHGTGNASSPTESIRYLANSALRATQAREAAPTLPGTEVVRQLRQVLTRPAVPTRNATEELAEEKLNAMTHGAGIVLSLIGLVMLVTGAGSVGGSIRIVTCGIYGVTLMLMYAASTSLHAAECPRLKLRFQVCDHVAIYLLIAGTYTPLLAILLNNYLGWMTLGCVWALAAIGITIKVRYATRLEETSPLPYVGLGWLALAVIKPLAEVMPIEGIALLVAGGVAYSVGVIFYCRDDKRGFHAIWHLFVVAGTICHFLAILLYVAS